jgi:hypothetical protein
MGDGKECLKCKKHILCKWHADLEKVVQDFASGDLAKHNMPELYEEFFEFFAKRCSFYQED